MTSLEINALLVPLRWYWAPWWSWHPGAGYVRLDLMVMWGPFLMYARGVRTMPRPPG